MRTFSAALFCLLLALLLFSGNAWASAKAKARADARTSAPVRKSAFYLAPTIGGYSFDSSEGLGSGVLYGLKLGYDFVGKGGVEALGVEGFASVIQPGSGTDVYQFRVDAIYPVFTKKKLTPFLALGGGWVYFDADSESDDAAVVALGFGVHYALETHLLLRTDLRNVVRLDSGHPNHFEYTLALTYVFGRERPPKAMSVLDSISGDDAQTQRSPDSPDGRARRNLAPAKDAEPDPTPPCPYPLQDVDMK